MLKVIIYLIVGVYPVVWHLRYAMQFVQYQRKYPRIYSLYNRFRSKEIK